MATRRPDIVLVMTDQQRFDQVGFRSGGFYETPALDAFAQRGVVFANAYSAAATCVPARVSLLTGVHAPRLAKTEGPHLAEGVWTVAHELRRAGYETALIGKMHFVPVHAAHGFDVMRIAEHLNAMVLGRGHDGRPDLDDYHQWLVDQGVASWRSTELGAAPVLDARRERRRGEPPFPFTIEHHATTWIETEVRALLARRRRDRPLFLVVSFPHPHPPLNPPEPYWSRYDPAEIDVPAVDARDPDMPEPFVRALRGGTPRFGGWRVAEHGTEPLRRRLTQVRALVRQIDDAFGRLLALLPLDRTVVAFTSDHGDYAGHHGLAGKVPWIPFDDLVRVPLVVGGAGVAGGRTVEAFAHSSDLPLTFCELAGVEPTPPRDRFDSESLAGVLRGAAGRSERPAVFASNAGWPGARLGAVKLIVDLWTQSRVVFDLDADPGETRDASGDPQHRDAVGELDRLLGDALARPRLALDEFAAPAPAAHRSERDRHLLVRIGRRRKEP